MLEAGFQNNLLLSSDGGASEALLTSKGGPGYARTLTTFVPKFRAAGVDVRTIDAITIDNPRRFLGFVPRD